MGITKASEAIAHFFVPPASSAYFKVVLALRTVIALCIDSSFGMTFDTRVREADIYLRWFLGDGQVWIDNDPNALAMGMTEIKVGERTYEYYAGDAQGNDSRLFGIRWLQDGYLFEISILEEFIIEDGGLDETLLLKYTELSKVIIEK
jgi:hypothetical protein